MSIIHGKVIQHNIEEGCREALFTITGVTDG